MKIVLVDTTINGEIIGGAQTFLATLMAGLVAAGHEVHLLADGEGRGRIRETISSSGAQVHANLLNRTVLVDDATPDIAKWINDLSPDTYVISVSPDIGWAVLPWLNRSIATVNIAHSNSKAFYDPLRHYSQFVTRSVGVSHEICEKFQSYSNVDREKVEWIPYGVVPLDEPSAESSSAVIRLVYVGRLAEPDKKVSDLIKLVKHLRGSSLIYSLRVIGDGPMMPDFRRELRDEIESGRVYMHGWLNSEELLNYLRESDISLLVSESEGFCISLVEAMANGCCPVVTDIESGNKQLVDDGVNGFVVPVGDVDAFIGKIKFLADNRERLNEMRARAWETGREYSIDRMVSNYVSCFEKAIEDAKQNPRALDPDFPLMESCRSKYPLWLRRLKARLS